MTAVPNTRKTSPLPNASEPVIDRYRRWTPTWYRWIKPLLDRTNDNATVLKAVSDDLTSAQAAITTEQTVRAAADTALASSITSLSTTVAGHTTTLTQQASTIDGIEAHWGVNINTDGRVVGAIRLDGTAVESVFGVLADKFLVVHPSLNGTTIQAFIVGLVNGSPSVGINGNLIVDGTILARHIAVNTLDAIAGSFGTITTGKMQRQDGTMIVDLDNKRIKIST